MGLLSSDKCGIRRKATFFIAFNYTNYDINWKRYAWKQQPKRDILIFQAKRLGWAHADKIKNFSLVIKNSIYFDNCFIKTK